MEDQSGNNSLVVSTLPEKVTLFMLHALYVDRVLYKISSLNHRIFQDVYSVFPVDIAWFCHEGRSTELE